MVHIVYCKTFLLISELIVLWYIYQFFFFTGMGKEVENLIMENNELLATK